MAGSDLARWHRPLQDRAICGGISEEGNAWPSAKKERKVSMWRTNIGKLVLPIRRSAALSAMSKRIPLAPGRFRIIAADLACCFRRLIGGGTQLRLHNAILRSGFQPSTV